MEKIVQQGPIGKNWALEADKLQTPFKQDSLKKRYIYKLFANFFGLGISFITQAIIPRGLGPKAYGDFNFLTNFFSQVVSFLDMGASTAFYTKLSQRPKESSLVSFYLYFAGIISLGMFGLVLLSIATSTYSKLWPGQDIFYICLAAGWGIIYWLVKVLNSMADAYGVTVSAELARIFQKVLVLILIVSLYVLHQLNLTTFFSYQYFLFIVLGLFFYWIMKKSFLRQNWLLSRGQTRRYFHEFYHYCHPLFTYSLIGLIVGLLDRWLLQIYAGSVQQGFYGLSYQIGSLCFLFTGAMTPLFTRELSIAFSNGDLPRMAELFRRYIPMLYSVAAFFSCFIAVQANKVVYIFGGNKFEGAATAVTIMAFYPLHQTYGQLSGSVFLATGQTHLYRNIGVVLMLLGLPITYFMIVPKEPWGLGMGASGLAIKMVLFNIMYVNVQLYFNSKYLKFSFFKFLVHQIFVIVCLLIIAMIATIAGNKVLAIWGSESVVFSFLLSGVLYTLMVIGLIYFLPIFMGLKKQDIQSLAHKMGMMLKI